MCSMRPKRETAADMTALVARLKACASQSSQSTHHKRSVTTTTTDSMIATTTTTTMTSGGNTCATTATESVSALNTANDTTEQKCSGSAAHVFRAGMKVEAKDAVGDWYASKVVEVSEDGDRCLVHFTRWSSRFDEWVPVSSVRIRSMDTSAPKSELKSAAKSALNQSVCGNSGGASVTADKAHEEYAVGEQVLARWSDGKRYSATIRHVFVDQNAVLVVFDDNYRKKVKLNAISKLNANSMNEQNIETMKAIIPSQTTTTTPSEESVGGVGVGGGNGFIKCGTCGKTFRKASLMLWHERHCTQTTENAERRKNPQQSSEQQSTQTTPQRQQLTNNANTCVTSVPSVVPKRAINAGVASRRTRRTKSGRRRRRRFTANTSTSSQQIVNDDNTLTTNNTECPLVSASTDINVTKTTTTTTTSTTAVDNVLMGNTRKAVKRRRSSQRADVTVVQTSTLDSTRVSVVSSGQHNNSAQHCTPPPPQPNTRLPFWDAKGVAEQHESDDVPEVVHCCHCDEFEESGLMVQCDLCLSWQHAACVGYNANCQHEYICGACLRPRLMRASKRFDFSVSLLLKPNSRFRENTFHISNGQYITNTSHDDDDGEDGDGVGGVGCDALAHAFERVHDVSQVIASLSARVAKLDRNDSNEQNETNDTQMMDIARTQQKLQTVLNALEEKVNVLEQNDANDASIERQPTHDDAWIKLQTQLLFEDLKNARKICEN